MSEQPYTPTTQRVLDTYIWCDMGSTSDEWDAARSAEFNRWLDRERAEARREGQAEAWEEGLDAGRDRWMDAREFGDPPVNPYRIENGAGQ